VARFAFTQDDTPLRLAFFNSWIHSSTCTLSAGTPSWVCSGASLDGFTSHVKSPVFVCNLIRCWVRPVEKIWFVISPIPSEHKSSLLTPKCSLDNTNIASEGLPLLFIRALLPLRVGCQHWSKGIIDKSCGNAHYDLPGLTTVKSVH
jgi:hypothetical protein